MMQAAHDSTQRPLQPSQPVYQHQLQAYTPQQMTAPVYQSARTAPGQQERHQPMDLFEMASRHMEALMDGFFRADPFLYAGGGGFGSPMLGFGRNPPSNRMLQAGPQQGQLGLGSGDSHYGQGRQDVVLQQGGGQALPAELARFTSFDQILRDFDAVTFPDFGSDMVANDPQNLGTGSFSQVFVARQKQGADGKLHTEKYFNTNLNGVTLDGDRIGQKEEMYHNTEQNLKRIAQQRTLNDQGLKVVKSRFGDQPEEVHTIQNGFEDSGRAEFERRWQEGSRRVDFSRALSGPSYSRNPNQLTSSPVQMAHQPSLPYTSSVAAQPLTSTATYSSPVKTTSPGALSYTQPAAQYSPAPMSVDYQGFNANQEPIVIRSDRRAPPQAL